MWVVNSQWLLHSLEDAHRQVIAANGPNPQDDQNKGQHEAEI